MRSPVRGGVCRGLIPSAAPSLLVTASMAVLLCGCGSTGDITARIAPTRQPGTLASAVEPGAPLAAPGGAGSSNVSVSPRQHAYLDALAAAGVRSSSDLRALSIGSYVCQGHAAGQSDQAVWDFVFPLVRNDVKEVAGLRTAESAPTITAEDATARYIRIATERLC